MPELDTKARDRLPDDAFAYIDAGGERHLPIHDEAHVRNAIARWPRTRFESRSAKREAARRILEAARRYGIEVDPGDEIVAGAKDR
ncbi:MAG TPA: DUF6582 domain-containing protein [Candidatus Limnocylindrales bacterium]|nr:DUF6582 domain-containing protein [Candidatus Limnocylindrales bacterium]